MRRAVELADLWPGALGTALVELGLDPVRRGSRYELVCPACGERRAYVYGDGAPTIRCNRRNECGYRMLVFDALASRLGGTGAALEWLRGRAGQPAPAAQARSGERRPEGVSAFWLRCLPIVPATLDAAPSAETLEVSRYLESRAINPADVAALGLARATTAAGSGEWPAWWPASWARSWRLIVRAYEADGRLASVHARAIDRSTPRTRWPLGCSARGLLFADGPGQSLLRGELDDPGERLDGVLIVEGLTDWLSASLRVASSGRRMPVIGVTAGGPPAFARVRIPTGVPVIVATDADGAGDEYARQIRAALPPEVDVRRARVRTGCAP